MRAKSQRVNGFRISGRRRVCGNAEGAGGLSTDVKTVNGSNSLRLSKERPEVGGGSRGR